MHEWILVGAKKVALRTQSADVQNSIWEITLRDRGTGKLHQFRGDVDSFKDVANRAGQVRHRKYRYNHSGGEGVLKEVHWFDDDWHAALRYGKRLPRLLVKSLHEEVYNRRDASDLGTMQDAARALRIQGMPAIAVTRLKPRTSRRAGKPCFSMVVEHFGDDFIDAVYKSVNTTDPKNRIDVTSPAGAKRLLLSIVRALAVIQFFHETFDCDIRDIKPDNMNADVDRSGHITKLKFFDLRGLIVRNPDFTPGYMNKRDLEELLEKKVLPKSTDFHTFSNAMAVMISALQGNTRVHNLDVREIPRKITGNSEICYVVREGSSNYANSPLTNLLTRMRRCGSAATADDVLRLFCKQAPDALGREVVRAYNDEFARIEQAYREDEEECEDAEREAAFALCGGGGAAAVSVRSSTEAAAAVPAAIDPVIMQAWRRLTEHFRLYEYASVNVLEKKCGHYFKYRKIQDKLDTLGQKKVTSRLFEPAEDPVKQDYRLVTSDAGLAAVRQWRFDAQTRVFSETEVAACWAFTQREFDLSDDADFDVVSECIHSALDAMNDNERAEFAQARLDANPLKKAMVVLHQSSSWGVINEFKASGSAVGATLAR